MERMYRTGMQAFTMAMLTAVFVSVLGMTALLVALRLAPAGSPVWDDLRCAIGFPSQSGGEACIQRRLEEAQKERRRERQELDGVIREQRERNAALEDERAAHEAARAALEEQLARLRRIEASVSNFNLFTKRSYLGAGDVHTGVEYPSFVDHQEWSSAWCYWSPPGRENVRIALGTATPSGGVIDQTIDSEAVRRLGVDPREAEAAKSHCVWPETVS